MKKRMPHAIAVLFLALTALAAAGCSQPPTTREQGALVGDKLMNR